MRHGESLNNQMRGSSEDFYRESRTEDPGLSDKGVAETREVAMTLKELGIELDGVMTSAFRRGLESAKVVQEVYTSTPIVLKVKLHKRGGCYLEGKPRPGMTRS